MQILGATQTSIADCLVSNNNASPAYESAYVGISIAESSFTKVHDTRCTGFGSGVIIGNNTEGMAAIARPLPACAFELRPGDNRATVHVRSEFVDCHIQADGDYTGPGPGIEISSCAIVCWVRTGFQFFAIGLTACSDPEFGRAATFFRPWRIFS